MSALLDQVRESLEGPIDFVGQKYAEQYAQNVLIPSASIGFVVGWLAQDIRITLGIFGFGVLLALAIAVPPWSFYNENPVAWLPVIPAADAPETKKAI